MKSFFQHALTKRRLIIVVLALVLVIWGARSCRKQSLADIEGVKSSPDSITPPDDVLTLYKSELPKYLTRIGARPLYSLPRGHIMEGTGEEVRWTEEEMSAADKLNGITHRYWVDHRFSFMRQHSGSDGWGDWGKFSGDFRFKIERRNGALKIEVYLGDMKSLTLEELKRVSNP